MRRTRLDATVRAAEWLLRIEDGPLTDADRAGFLAWLKASPLNVREYLGVARTGRRLQGAFKKRAVGPGARAAMQERLVEEMRRAAMEERLEEMRRAAESLGLTAHTRSKGRNKANGGSNGR